MPGLSKWMIRIALVYLGIGFTFGGLLLFNKGVPSSPILWRLLPTHIEFLLIGWTVQLVMGMAFWILPRFSREPRRGNLVLIWMAFGLLNLGVLMVGLGGLFDAPTVIPIVGRAAELGAGMAFAIQVWPRIKAIGVG